MKLHALGQAKRQLYRQVEAASKASAGTEAHLVSVKSFHKAAWECFAARKVDPPEQRTEYVYTINQGGIRTTLPKQKGAEAQPIDPRTKKAIFCIELDCNYCWAQLNKAVENWPDGSRGKIRCIDTLSKWRKTYDAYWDAWFARGRKKLPVGLKRLHQFAEANGRVHFVAGADAEGKYFASAKEAQKFVHSCESFIKQAEADQLYHSETNRQLMDLFDRAQENPELWTQLEQALKQAEDEDKQDDETENS